MSDFMADIADEADLSAAPKDNDIQNVRDIAQEMLDLDTKIAERNKITAELQSRRSEIADRILVDAMMEFGLDSLGMPDANCDILLQPWARASIPKGWPDDQRKESFDYLESIDAGDLVKNTVTFNFGRGDHNIMKSFLEAVKQLEEAPSPEIDTTVQHGTLTAFVKRQLAEGQPLDLAKLGATVGNAVKIKMRKDK